MIKEAIRSRNSPLMAFFTYNLSYYSFHRRVNVGQNHIYSCSERNVDAVRSYFNVSHSRSCYCNDTDTMSGYT